MATKPPYYDARYLNHWQNEEIQEVVVGHDIDVKNEDTHGKQARTAVYNNVSTSIVSNTRIEAHFSSYFTIFIKFQLLCNLRWNKKK